MVTTLYIIITEVFLQHKILSRETILITIHILYVHTGRRTHENKHCTQFTTCLNWYIVCLYFALPRMFLLFSCRTRHHPTCTSEIKCNIWCFQKVYFCLGSLGALKKKKSFNKFFHCFSRTKDMVIICLNCFFCALMLFLKISEDATTISHVHLYPSVFTLYSILQAKFKQDKSTLFF